MSLSQRRVSSKSHHTHARYNSDSHWLVALIFFEHLLTTDREIDLFWRHEFSGAGVLFLTNRYLILVSSTLSLVALFNVSVTDEVSATDSYSWDSMWADIFAPS